MNHEANLCFRAIATQLSMHAKLFKCPCASPKSTISFVYNKSMMTTFQMFSMHSGFTNFATIFSSSSMHRPNRDGESGHHGSYAHDI